jgi:hypothetical protein
LKRELGKIKKIMAYRSLARLRRDLGARNGTAG